LTRILWHIFVDPEEQAPYAKRLADYLASLAAPGVEFDLVGLRPPDTRIHRISELRTGAQVVADLIEGESGYDAAVVGHFQDPGLWEARSALEIPVLGLGEGSMLFACMFARRVGIVTISPSFIPWHEEQIHHYGLDQRVTAVTAIETSVDLFIEAFEDEETYRAVKGQFDEQAARLAELGCELVIPAGGLPALLFRQEAGHRVGGAEVLNPTAVLALQAQSAAAMRGLSGFGTSRHSTFALASADVREQYVEQLGGHAVPLPRRRD
jgi:Asp/Glu/hydantoin racemase